jgi:protease-4
MLNGGRSRTPEEIQIVQQLVRNTYNEFTRIVAESRKIPVEKIRTTEIGDGRIFDGEQALKLGLVDSLGYFRDAVEITAKNAKLKPGSYTVIRYKEQFSFARLMSMLSARSGSVPVNVSFGGTSSRPAFMPKPGMLYYLPANF